MSIDKRIEVNFMSAPVEQGQSKIAEIVPPSEIYIPDEVQQFAANLKADPRFRYVHIIAMSDGNHYGPNLNGDVFEWDQLTGLQTPEEAAKNPPPFTSTPVPRYKTFEFAKYYRRHANRPTDPAFGDIPLAVINTPMKRVELIIRVAREDIPDLGLHGAPDIAAKLDESRPLAGSMGCRISHEKCSYCGHENELTSGRCNHLKLMMGDIMPNGVKVAALNYGFRFFDYSDVIIPADPIALSLSKVAAKGCSAKRKPNVAVDVKSAEKWRQKWSEIVKEVPADSIGAVGGECPECEKSRYVPAAFSDDELKSAMVAAYGDLNNVVSTATMLGVVFSPVEMAKLAAFNTPADYDGIVGMDTLALDKFNYFVYDALRSKIEKRSGFLAPCPETDWDPVKIAERGHRDVGDYYAYYRSYVSSFPASAFTKLAYAFEPTRNLLGSVAEQPNRLKAVMFYLARAGLGT